MFNTSSESLHLQIKSIDEAISEQATHLFNLQQQLNFREIGKFELSEECGPLCDNTFNQAGLYFFELKNKHNFSDPNLWFETFEPTWTARGFRWHSGLKKGRLARHSSFSEWIPLYIGKSRFIGKRINEHILQPSDKTTFSMKLKSTNSLHGNTFRVSWLPIEVKNYDMIVPTLERLMRDRFNPIVGKQ